MPRATLPALLIIAVLAPVAASARIPHAAVAANPSDPWEKFNRRMFAFNQGLDRLVIHPLSRLTSGLTPGPIGRGVRNFVVNLKEPVVFLNDLLQAKPVRAAKSAFRFVVNSTVGVLGAIDVAHALGDRAEKNGFGDTLGRWGAVPGPYIVLPVLGPATFRDLVGSVVDDATEPLTTIDFPYRTEVDIVVSFVSGLNERSEVSRELDALLEGAADPYATLRSAYLQSREAEIRGETALPPLPDIEDTAPQPDPAGVVTPDTTAPPAVAIRPSVTDATPVAPPVAGAASTETPPVSVAPTSSSPATASAVATPDSAISPLTAGSQSPRPDTPPQP